MNVFNVLQKLTAVIFLFVFTSCGSRQGSQGPAGPAGASPTPVVKNYDLSLNLMWNSLNSDDIITGHLSYTDTLGVHNSDFSDTNNDNSYSVTTTGKTGDTISIIADVTATTCTSCTTYFNGTFMNNFNIEAYDPISGLTSSWSKSFTDTVPANTKTVHITLTKQLP
jgi:hypothetical protein